MPYKNKELQKQYQREWYQLNKENVFWANTIWREKNIERKRELNRKSWHKHKEYYNWLRRFQTKLDNMDS